MKYKIGDKVKCNGNPQGVIVDMYRGWNPDGPTVESGGMYIVRLWSGTRLVGDVVVSERDLNLEN